MRPTSRSPSCRASGLVAPRAARSTSTASVRHVEAAKFQPDAAGALLDVVLPEVRLAGPMAIGYGSHFGLGLFVPARTTE